MKEAALKRIRMGQAVAGQFAFGVKWRKAVRDMSCFGAMLRDENGMRQMEEEIFSELLQLQDQKEASGERYELYLYTPLRRRDTVLRMDQ